MTSELLTPTDSVRHTTRCSILDPMLMYVTSSIAFCYRERLDTARLRESLAQVLGRYGGYAGRLLRERGNWLIEHGVGGARFETAHVEESSATMGAVALAKDSRGVCPRISALGVMRGKEPLFAARISQTSDGTVVGITVNHAIGDAYSSMLLMRAWALAYRGEAYDLPFDVEDRGAYLREHLPPPAAELKHWRLLSWSDCWRNYLYQFWGTRPKRRIVLPFSANDVTEIHGVASRGTSVTPHDALSAHVFLTLQRLLGSDAGPCCGVAINYRQRLGLPANLLGNMSDTVAARTDECSDTAAVAVALRKSIKAVGTGPMSYPELERLRATHPRLLHQIRYWNASWQPCRVNLILTNVAGLKYYDLVFGSTRPVFVHARGMDQDATVGLGTIAPGPDGGVTVDIVLPGRWAEPAMREHGRPALAVLRDNERSPRPASTDGTADPTAVAPAAPM